LYKHVLCDDDHKFLQCGLNALQEWSDKWLLKLNASKCKTVGNYAEKLRSNNLYHTTCMSPSHKFRFIYLTKFTLGNRKYVNKMHFIK